MGSGTDPVTKSVGKVLSSVLPKSVMPKKFTFVHLIVVVVVVFMLYHALTDNVEGYFVASKSCCPEGGCSSPEKCEAIS